MGLENYWVFVIGLLNERNQISISRQHARSTRKRKRASGLIWLQFLKLDEKIDNFQWTFNFVFQLVHAKSLSQPLRDKALISFKFSFKEYSWKNNNPPKGVCQSRPLGVQMFLLMFYFYLSRNVFWHFINTLLYRVF